MPELKTPRPLHRATHFAGAPDELPPNNIGAATLPTMKRTTSTSTDVTFGISGQGIVPRLLRHVVTHSGANTAQGTITFTYSDATTTVITSANDATDKTALWTWDDQDLAIGTYNAVESEETFPFTIETSSTPAGKILETVRVQTTGTGATANIEIRYLQF